MSATTRIARSIKRTRPALFCVDLRMQIFDDDHAIKRVRNLTG